MHKAVEVESPEGQSSCTPVSYLTIATRHITNHPINFKLMFEGSDIVDFDKAQELDQFGNIVISRDNLIAYHQWEIVQRIIYNEIIGARADKKLWMKATKITSYILSSIATKSVRYRHLIEYTCIIGSVGRQKQILRHGV